VGDTIDGGGQFKVADMRPYVCEGNDLVKVAATLVDDEHLPGFVDL
jgi:hypothetical protein